VRWQQRARLPFLVMAVLALLGALAGGLVRLGWPVPTTPGLVAFHGPLMVTGFLGTVIGLERAVALGRLWAYGAPLGCGLGAIALLAGLPGATSLMAIGVAVMVAVSVEIVWRQLALFTVVMALGACAWLAGQLLWSVGWPIHRVVFWWVSFLVLTIAAERLELTRVLRPTPNARRLFVLASGALLVGAALTAVDMDLGARVTGAALTGLAAWLGIFDIARRTVRTAGLPRFIGVALLSGYVWLGIAGMLLLRHGAVAGLPFDAILHAVFLGFVVSMIFGHAPIIFPAVLGLRIPYRHRFYVHLGVLHASLVLRVVGDLAPWPPARLWGGLLNGLAIAVFLVSTGAGALGPRVEESTPCRG